jgi:hypothetical protein
LVLKGKAGRNSAYCTLLSGDPNAALNLTATASFRDSSFKGTSKGSFRVNPGMLALYKDTFSLTGSWNADLSVKTQSLQASLLLKNIDWEDKNRHGVLREFHAELQSSDSLTLVEVSSDFMEATLNTGSDVRSLLKLPGQLLDQVRASLKEGYSGSAIKTISVVPYQVSTGITYHPVMDCCSRQYPV